MPLAPQIVITPITVTSSGMTTSSVDGVYSLNTASPAFKTVAADATDAWSAVLGKNTIFYATTAPAGSHTEGDTWFDTDNGYKIHKWDGTQWVATQFGSAAFGAGSVDLAALASGAVDATKLVDGAVVQSKVAAGAIGANQIAANAIVAGKIAADAITASNIQAGQITTSLLAAGAVTADKIAAGAISADMITTGTMSANRISGGTISGVLIDTTGGISTTGVLSGGTISSTGNIAGGSISTTGNLAVSGTAMAGNLYSTGVAGVQTPGTTAETVTWRVESSGGYFMLRRPSSRRELKEHIVDIADIPELDPALLLQIPVRAYKFKPGVLDETSSRNDVFVPGFIVEEMDAIYPMAVDYDENGQPLMWGESALIPGMLALIQQQARAIAGLQSRVEALEARP